MVSVGVGVPVGVFVGVLVGVGVGVIHGFGLHDPPGLNDHGEVQLTL